MMWFRRALFGLLVAFCASSAQAQIGTPLLIKSVANVTSGVAVTVTASSPAGALIVVGATDWAGSGTTFSAVTDSKGNTYTKAISVTPGAYGSSSIWYSSNALALASGVDTITITADSNGLALMAISVTGCNGGNDTNANSHAQTTSSVTTLTMPATGTLAVADELLVWAASNFATNFTGIAVSDAAGSFTIQSTAGAMATQIVSANTAQTVTGTWTNASSMSMVLTGFKITGGGAAVVNSRTLTGVGK